MQAPPRSRRRWTDTFRSGASKAAGPTTTKTVLVVLVVLVGVGAAVAAGALLVMTTLDFGGRSQETVESASGSDGTFQVVDAYLLNDPAGGRRLYVAVSPGIASEVPLEEVRVRLHVGGTEHVFRLGDEGQLGTFVMVPGRDANGSLAGPAPVLDGSDLAELEIDLAANGVAVPPGGEIVLRQGMSPMGTATLEVPARVGTGAIPLTVR